MRKILVGLLTAGLILVGGMGFAQDKVAKPSLQMVSSDVKATIEEEPTNIVSYFDFSVDFLSTVMAKIAKTAKPAYLFNGEVAFEVSVYENPTFDVIWGFCQDAQYYGIEAKEIPLTGVLPEIFEKIRPQVVYYTGDGGYITFGICYRFREEQ